MKKDELKYNFKVITSHNMRIGIFSFYLHGEYTELRKKINESDAMDYDTQVFGELLNQARHYIKNTPY